MDNSINHIDVYKTNIIISVMSIMTLLSKLSFTWNHSTMLSMNS